MAKLLVRDKNGVEREMTQRAYDLIGFKRKPEIIGKGKEAPKSDYEKEKDRLRAEKAAKQAEPEQSVESVQPEPEVKEVKKRGPKPKNTEA